mmetsp:Transcript_44557/g.127755  ORF Transcript_44557/g.127755 Transcript_44557/m.127755 type:complete len:223 (+) Transcript_44557:137-805(+)
MLSLLLFLLAIFLFRLATCSSSACLPFRHGLRVLVPGLLRLVLIRLLLGVAHRLPLGACHLCDHGPLLRAGLLLEGLPLLGDVEPVTGWGPLRLAGCCPGVLLGFLRLSSGLLRRLFSFALALHTSRSHKFCHILLILLLGNGRLRLERLLGNIGHCLPFLAPQLGDERYTSRASFLREVGAVLGEPDPVGGLGPGRFRQLGHPVRATRKPGGRQAEVLSRA